MVRLVELLFKVHRAYLESKLDKFKFCDPNYNLLYTSRSECY